MICADPFAPWHRPTMLESAAFDQIARRPVRVLYEGDAPSGSFKWWGVAAYVKAMRTTGSPTPFLVASSGNQGIAAARLAHEAGVRCAVVAPDFIPDAKRAKLRSFGAELVTYDPAREHRADLVRRMQRRREYFFIPSSDSPHIVDGYRSIGFAAAASGAVEAYVPVGGGGLLAAVARCAGPTMRVIGVEPSCNPKFGLALRGEPISFKVPHASLASALLAAPPSPLAIRVARECETRMTSVDDEQLARAQVLFFECFGRRAEPSALAGIAAILAAPIASSPALAIVTGSNDD